MGKRPGVTRKVSLSVHVDDLQILKERAKRLHRGNVSAVFAELIASLKRQEAWAKAVAWYGKPIDVAEEERQQIDGEILGKAPRKPARKRRAA
jgi:hypothetical protein